MWINREDYKKLEDVLIETRKTRDVYSERLDKVRNELDELKRSLMPTKHYQVIDINSGLRYDVDAVDYIQGNAYDRDYGYIFRKADYSMVPSIHKDISIQVVEEE